MDELTQKFFENLLRTQFLPGERMVSYQRGLIDRLVRHARAHVPFYRDRLDVLFTKDDRIDWDRWDEVPILTRAQAAQAGDALFAQTLPPDCGEVISSFTGGL